jgi:hypothetical protein
MVRKRYSADARSDSGATHLLLCAALITSLVILPRAAFAYLDPGTGSYIFQVLLATLLGGLVTLRMYWHRLKERLRGSKPSSKDEPR